MSMKPTTTQELIDMSWLLATFLDLEASALKSEKGLAPADVPWLAQIVAQLRNAILSN